MIIKGRSPTMRHVSGTHRVALDWLFGRLCCSKKFSLTSCTEAMAKTMLEQDGEERIVAKPRPTMNLAFHCVCKFFDCAESDCVEKLREYSRHLFKMIGQVQGNLTQKNSRTQRRVLMDSEKMQFCKYEETCRDRRRPGTLEFS